MSQAFKPPRQQQKRRRKKPKKSTAKKDCASKSAERANRNQKEIRKARSEKKTKNCNTVEWFVSRLSYAGAGAAAAVVQVEHLWD